MKKEIMMNISSATDLVMSLVTLSSVFLWLEDSATQKHRSINKQRIEV